MVCASRAVRKAVPAALALTLALTFVLRLPTAHAARPLITDDARLVDAKACQVESWVRTNKDSKEYWALPACNFTGNLELTFGGARTSEATGTRTTDIMLQGKPCSKHWNPTAGA